MVPEFGRIRRISVAGKTGSARSSASALVPGIAIKNRGANWVIDELCARRWDGRLPRTVPGDLPCVEFTDGTWKSGDEAKAFDLGQVQSVAWSADVPPLRPKMPRAAAAFADGTMISGSLVSFAGGGFDMRAPWSAGPVHSSGEGLLRIVFEPPASPANEPSPATLDLIHAGSVTIHGSISGDGGKEPLWRFVGGRAALPVAVPSRREDVELTWARPLETEPQAPARSFLITDAGDVLSASILGIDETGVSFASPWTEARTLAHEHARAIRMAARKVESKGFRDSGWGVVKGDDHLAKVTPGEKPDEDMLRLEPGGAFGHPYLGGGDDIRFSMSMPDHYGGLSMDFFAGDGADEHEGLKLMLWRSGNQLYAVAGDANNGVRRDQMLKDDGEAPVSIRIIFNDSKVQLFANESPMLTESVTPAQRRQTGLRLSCASLWGNTMRTMEVSDFSVADHPGSFDAVNVTERAKREALLVPRFRRESPPSHALVAVNGDVIRGRVDAATEKLVRFTSGLETMNMPAERVRNIIWLRKPAPDPKDGSTPPASLAAPPKAAAASHWLVLQDNSRLALTIDAFMPDKVLGRSELLGKFEVPLNKIALLRWAPASATSALKSYTDWQLENAPEPVLPEGGSQASPLLGKAAPDFKLPLLDGGDFELSKMRGQVVVVDFWATWCGPCVASMPDLIQAMKAFEGKKVQFITLNQGEPEAQVRRFLKLRDWKLPVAMDARQEAAGKYGVEGIPHTVLIGTEGKVEWTHTGHTSDGAEKLTEAVKKALHE